MNINFVKVGKDKLPFKFSQRTNMIFEENAGIPITKMADPFSTKNLIIFCLAALETGHKIQEKDFNITQDQLLDLDDQYDVINQIISKFEDNEKKQ